MLYLEDFTTMFFNLLFMLELSLELKAHTLFISSSKKCQVCQESIVRDWKLWSLILCANLALG